MMIRFALALTLSAAGCGIADFDVTQSIPSQTISGSPLGGLLPSLLNAPLALTIDSDIKARDTGPIDSINLSSMDLHITTSGADWSFVSSVDVSVSSTKSGSSLATVKVATVSNPGAVTTMRFQPVSGVNLVPYINEGSQMSADATGTEPSQDVTFDGAATFHVHPF